MYNITRIQDFSDYIPLKNPHQIPSEWELKANILLSQNENDYKLWSKYRKRLVSKVIPSQRIQREIDTNLEKLVMGYPKIILKGTDYFVPVVILRLLKTRFIPAVSPRIYQDLWFDAEPEDYQNGLNAMEPPPDAPAANNKRWIRKYFYEDLQDHIKREDKILDFIANGI